MPVLSEVTYPVFRLKSEIKTSQGITYAITQDKIVDNKNLAGDTLAQRRLQYRSSELSHLGQTLTSLAEVNKFPKRTKFIDSKGIIFSINKKVFYKLTYHKVENVKHTDSHYTNYIRCEGVRKWIRYDSFNSPKVEQYVGLLHFHSGYIVYEISDIIQRNTRRML